MISLRPDAQIWISFWNHYTNFLGLKSWKIIYISRGFLNEQSSRNEVAIHLQILRCHDKCQIRVLESYFNVSAFGHVILAVTAIKYRAVITRISSSSTKIFLRSGNFGY